MLSCTTLYTCFFSGCQYDGGDCCGDSVGREFCQDCFCIDPTFCTPDRRQIVVEGGGKCGNYGYCDIDDESTCKRGAGVDRIVTQSKRGACSCSFSWSHMKRVPQTQKNMQTKLRGATFRRLEKFILTNLWDPTFSPLEPRHSYAKVSWVFVLAVVVFPQQLCKVVLLYDYLSTDETLTVVCRMSQIFEIFKCWYTLRRSWILPHRHRRRMSDRSHIVQNSWSCTQAI